MEVLIPKELDFVVERAFKQGRKEKNRTPQWVLGSPLQLCCLLLV